MPVPYLAGVTASMSPQLHIDGAPATVEALSHPAPVNYGHFTAMQVRHGAVRRLQLHLGRLRAAHLELFRTDLDTGGVRTARTATRAAAIAWQFWRAPTTSDLPDAARQLRGRQLAVSARVVRMRLPRPRQFWSGPQSPLSNRASGSKAQALPMLYVYVLSGLKLGVPRWAPQPSGRFAVTESNRYRNGHWRTVARGRQFTPMTVSGYLQTRGSQGWWPVMAAMHAAVSYAAGTGTPWVLDPVAAGALRWRTDLAGELLEVGRPAIIRGNASEILALAGGEGGKGVDSTDSPEAAAEVARTVARERSTVVAVSGPVDHITDGDRLVRIANGHPWLTQVTGVGCALGALMAGFAVAVEDPLVAAVSATAVLTVSADIAATASRGPGGFAVRLLDELSLLTPASLAERVTVI